MAFKPASNLLNIVPKVVKKENRYCEKHGDFLSEFRSEAMGWSGCAECLKDSYYETAKLYKGDVDAVGIQGDMNLKIKQSGIPERFSSKNFNGYVIDENNEKQRVIFDFCTSYALNFEKAKRTGQSFMLLGGVGTGKTHLAVVIAIEVMKRRHSVVFTSASKLIRSIINTYSKGSDQRESEAIAIYTDCDLLIIDEVGVQRGTHYEKDMIFDVINERYENLRPTIVLSNLNLAEIRKYLGERVLDRFRENEGKAFLLDWDSYRGRVDA